MSPYFNMFLFFDGYWNPFVLPLAIHHFQRHVVQHPVQQVGWAQVRGVVAVVSRLRVFLQPWGLIGSVVQHNISQGQHL